jgi:hypothetical protein
MMQAAIGSPAWPLTAREAPGCSTTPRSATNSTSTPRTSTPISRRASRSTLIATDRYEGRVSAIGSKDGKGLWMACERGNQQWGLDMRAHGHPQGLNGRKDTVFAYFDLTSGKVEVLPSPDALFADLPGPTARRKCRAAWQQPESQSQGRAAGESPRRQRQRNRSRWSESSRRRESAAPHARCRRPSVAHGALLQGLLLAHGAHTLRCRHEAVDEALRHPRQRLFAGSPDHACARQGWQPVDRLAERSAHLEAALNSGIHLAKVATDWICRSWPRLHVKPREPFPAYINPVTPERDRDERHTWTHDGVTYKLYWGDYHRHTDVSNCITANDGCISSSSATPSTWASSTRSAPATTPTSRRSTRPMNGG